MSSISTYILWVMKYDEAGRENVFKYDKTRESSKPIYKKKSSRGLRVSLQKSDFEMPLCGLDLKASWLLRPTEGVLAASLTIMNLRIIKCMSTKM